MKLARTAILLILILVFQVAVSAQDSGRIDWPRYQDMAVDLMQQYLRINTSNPPGNEIEAARFLKENLRSARNSERDIRVQARSRKHHRAPQR